MTNPELIDLAMRVVQTDAPMVAGDGEACAPEEQPQAVVEPPPLPAAPSKPNLMRVNELRGTKTAEELAAMIFSDLRNVDGCPKDGINVTVYGSNPWNCWLHFGAAAGPLRNKAELQEFCDIITNRLRRLYDVLIQDRDGG